MEKTEQGSDDTLRPSDYRTLQSLSPHGGDVLSHESRGLKHLANDLTELAAAHDLPELLRSYYAELSQNLNRLLTELNDLEESSSGRADQLLDQRTPIFWEPLPPEEVSDLLGINARLVELEK